MKKLRIALDCDDVLYNCNGYALEKLNQETGARYELKDITRWGKLESPIDMRLEYFNHPSFYEQMPLMKGAQEFVHRLSEISELFVVTSVPPCCMGARVTRLLSDFKDLKPENIFMGRNKSLLQVDMLLDDGLHNIRGAKIDYPVLYRRPWNTNASGILCVNVYEEFMTLVETVLNTCVSSCKKPEILCVVGPSGSGKNMIINQLLKRPGFVRVKTWTTRPRRPEDKEDAYHYITAVEFEKEHFFESTVYGGFYYGTKEEDIIKASQNGIVLIALDVCGCMAMKHRFSSKCALIYIRREREKLLGAILERRLEKVELMKRILSMDLESKNEELCDYTIDNNGSINDAVKQIEDFID